MFSVNADVKKSQGILIKQAINMLWLNPPSRKTSFEIVPGLIDKYFLISCKDRKLINRNHIKVKSLLLGKYEKKDAKLKFQRPKQCNCI